MAVAENLKVTHSVRDEVKVVDGKVERVEGKVEDVGYKVEGIGYKVDDVGGKVEVVGGKIEDMSDKVNDIGDKVNDIGDRVEDIGDKVQGVDENVQVVIEGARGMSGQSPIPANIFTQRARKQNSFSNKRRTTWMKLSVRHLLAGPPLVPHARTTHREPVVTTPA